jgi:hypothetical protein
MAENIHQAILEVMKEVEYVQKERSKGVNYTLKTENAVISAVRPAMVKHGIVMYPVQVDDLHHSSFEAGKYDNHWNRLVAVHTYRFEHAPSGTHIDVAVIGDGADTGDKAGNKSMTTSKKYALLETFLLETGDDPDTAPSPKRGNGNGKRRSSARQPAKGNGKNKRPLPAEDVQRFLHKRVSEYTKQNKTASQAQDRLLKIVYPPCFLDDNERHTATKWLLGKTSLNDFGDAEVLAFLDWLSLETNSDGEHIPSDDAMQEVKNVIRAAMKAQGQKELL